MARLFWLMVMAAIGAALVLGASWAAAYTAVANVLGAPPPQMGKIGRASCRERVY